MALLQARTILSLGCAAEVVSVGERLNAWRPACLLGDGFDHCLDEGICCRGGVSGCVEMPSASFLYCIRADMSVINCQYLTLLHIFFSSFLSPCLAHSILLSLYPCLSLSMWLSFLFSLFLRLPCITSTYPSHPSPPWLPPILPHPLPPSLPPGHNPFTPHSLVRRHVALPSNRPKFLCEKLLGVDEDEPVGNGRREGEGDRESWWVCPTSRWVGGGGEAGRLTGKW